MATLGEQMNFWMRQECEECGSNYPSTAPRDFVHADGTVERRALCSGCMEELGPRLDPKHYARANTELPYEEIFSRKELNRLRFMRWLVDGNQFDQDFAALDEMTAA